LEPWPSASFIAKSIDEQTIFTLELHFARPFSVFANLLNMLMAFGHLVTAECILLAL